MSKQCVSLLVSGKVQGVYFRLSLKEVADKNGVFGWVKNLDDGRVEALLQGESDGVDAVVQWAHHGPKDAAVSDVKATHQEMGVMYTGFVITA